MAFFMWPKTKYISVPTGERMTTSVIMRHYWIKLSWGETQKMLMVRPLAISWVPGVGIKFKRCATPWIEEYTWELDFLVIHIRCSPLWVHEAARIHCDAKWGKE